ncbi:hypothetical protein CLOM_g19696 [Closterium sp. NIES-68]|nr:hypothetical protein CLOM_g19696 [Closterium sp. NIES-68]GJP73528.1 hypothetical protein CLOP_g4230 [Closterium sp. NIES-67]GJP80559.1 hypothetical protein CLOP_g10762 [Closterium sp. NIES-67]
MDTGGDRGEGWLVGAIDQGTTSTRFFLYDEHLRVVASHQMEFEQIQPQAGWVEHDPMVILSTVRECMEGAIAAARSKGLEVGPDTVRAVGLTNQRETTVVWRRSTGEPLHNAIVWMDVRTSALCQRLEQQLPGGRDEWRGVTGLPLSTYFSALKLTWLLEEVPAVRQAVEEGDALFGTIDTWLIWNLTGGATHVTDSSNASRTLLMDLRALQWSDPILKALNIPRSILPSIISSAEHIAPITSSWPLAGVPLSGCLGDQHAAMLGQRCSRGQAKATFGTGCFMLLNTGPQVCASQHGLLSTVAFQLGSRREGGRREGGRGEEGIAWEEASSTVSSASSGSSSGGSGTCYYALEGSIAIAGAAVQWLRDNLGIISSAQEVEPLAASVPDTGGVYFVPAFSGLFAPRWREDARGVIVGLSRFTTRAHIARAVLEAIAWQTREVLDAMRSDAMQSGAAGVGSSGSSASSGDSDSREGESEQFVLRVDGGASVNSLLVQMQADFLGCPVQRPADIETTALGAALAAGIGVGLWREEEVLGGKVGGYGQSAEDGGRGEEGIGALFLPLITPEVREQRFASWCKAVERSLDLNDLA